MKIDFFKCKSSAESTFRLFICNTSLILAIACFFFSAVNILKDSDFRSEILRSAFSVEQMSELEAYQYRDFFLRND